MILVHSNMSDQATCLGGPSLLCMSDACLSQQAFLWGYVLSTQTSCPPGQAANALCHSR